MQGLEGVAIGDMLSLEGGQAVQTVLEGGSRSDCKVPRAVLILTALVASLKCTWRMGPYSNSMLTLEMVSSAAATPVSILGWVSNQSLKSRSNGQPDIFRALGTFR